MSVVSRWKTKRAKRKKALARTRKELDAVGIRRRQYLKKWRHHNKQGKKLADGSPEQLKNRRSRLWYRAHYLKAKARHRDLSRLEQQQAAAVAAATRVIRRHSTSLRQRALKVAESMIGVMEHGGNNRGEVVERIIRANGGVVGEPWCGDFVAWCYRKAGSTSVERAWASVYFLGRLPKLPRTTRPLGGDIVRFTFSHTGLYVKHTGSGQIQAIEGNTGASGAVSDSSTGGDGVYRKTRGTGLVEDYRAVKA